MDPQESGDKAAHWAKRKRGKRNEAGEVESDVVGRIPMVPMARPEVYHLRLLLFHVKGPTSYEALHTSDDGQVFATFQQACVFLGLIPNDDVFREILDEVKETMFGRHLRRLFCTLLAYHTPSDAMAIFADEDLQRCLAEDFRRRDKATLTTHVHVNAALADIEDILQGMGRTLGEFKLPLPDRDLLANTLHLAVREELHYDRAALDEAVQAKYPSLNDEQRAVFDTVLESVESSEGRVFCLNAGGGTGKTYTLNLLLDAVRARGRVALATATSGIAATLLHGGRTVHSRFKVPLSLSEESTCSMDKGSKEVCKMASLIVIDEVTMGHRHMYECLDRSLRDVMSAVAKDRMDKLFGGITVLFAGDWRQILPVVPKGRHAQIIGACLLKSPIWSQVHTLSLVTNMRAALVGGGADQEFAQMLDDIGTGSFPQDRVGTDPCEMIIRVPTSMLFRPDIQAVPPNMTRQEVQIRALINHVFFSGDYAHQLDQQLEATPPPEEQTLEHAICNRAIICPTNALVRLVNRLAIDAFPGEEKIYFASDKLREEDHGEDYGVELLNTLDGGSSSFPDSLLRLKKGCIIMLLRNLDPFDGHCNGTRYVVRNLNRHTIQAEVANGAYKGRMLLIPRLKFNTSEDYPFQFTRTQFPVRLAFGITSNKSQGQTYQQIGICLHNRPFFCHGQLYVALSRVGSKQNISISLGEDHGSKVDGGTCTANVVYRQVLRDAGILQ